MEDLFLFRAKSNTRLPVMRLTTDGPTMRLPRPLAAKQAATFSPLTMSKWRGNTKRTWNCRLRMSTC